MLNENHYVMGDLYFCDGWCEMDGFEHLIRRIHEASSEINHLGEQALPKTRKVSQCLSSCGDIFDFNSINNKADNRTRCSQSVVLICVKNTGMQWRRLDV
jgi:hypothetical protein